MALLALAGGARAQAPGDAAAALAALEEQTNALPRSAGAGADRRALRRAVATARSAAADRPCAALDLLARYRRLLGRLDAGRMVAGLGAASVVASERLLALEATAACGGGVPPTGLPSARTTVTESTVNGMRLRVDLPDLRYVPETGGGQAWTRLVLAGTDVADTGAPAIPAVTSTFAVPEGARVIVRPGATTGYTIDDVEVFPAQPQAVDQAVTPPPNFAAPPFTDPPFVIVQGEYGVSGPVPRRIASGALLGRMRDIRIGNLLVSGAQWNPETGRLKVVKSLEVTIRFRGGSKRFSPEVGSPWERPQRTLASGLLNAGLLPGQAAGDTRECGEEMLVITNPATRVAAEQLADARRAAGLRTSVAQTGSAAGGIGRTASDIRRLVRNRLTAPGCVHPSYVTILGDDDLVPTYRYRGGERIPSDLPYAMSDRGDELPDLAIGRIPGADAVAVSNAVAKIVRYETSPPDGPMLSRATIAAEFQDDDGDGGEDRTFVTFAETVRDGLLRRGLAVDRIYGHEFGVEPRRFNDGTDLPEELQRPEAWQGEAADVDAAWNAGRFLMIHRDHGWSDGWGTPAYDTSNVLALTNGSLLPVLLSINCSSAAYDEDETSFVGEALVKPDGGAAGAFGDTRDSPTRHNTQIGLGFVDALLPSVLPGEGPAVAQRAGGALVHGKLRLAAMWPPSSRALRDGDELTREELHLWHYFGDPSMQMWGGGTAPRVLGPAELSARRAGDAVEVELPSGLDGQTVSLLRDGQVVAKAHASGGRATIPLGGAGGGVLRIALEPDGSPPVSVPVEG